MTRNDMMFWIGIANIFVGMYLDNWIGSLLGAAIILWAYYLAPSAAVQVRES